jgi:hypothetical protein
MPIETVKRKDGTRGVYYFGHKAGDYAPVTYKPDNSRRWRVLSIHGYVNYARTEIDAQRLLLEMYH